MLYFVRILFFFTVLFSIVTGLAGYWIYENKLQTPFPLINDLPYTVSAGTNLAQIAMDLMDKQILDYPSALTWVMLARFQKRANLIKAGNYIIKVGMTPQTFLSLMIKGPVAHQTSGCFNLKFTQSHFLWFTIHCYYA